jgi:hypothetical protein
MTASQILFANNAGTTLAASITTASTVVNVATGTGALFPQPNPGQYFVCTVIDAATGLQREIMWCINVTGDALTVVRAQEGTTAKAYNEYDTLANLWTAGQAAAMQQGAAVEHGIIGFNGSNDGTTPHSIIDFTSGTTADPVANVQIILASALNKSTAAAWVAGNGGGMGTGLTVAINTWYYEFVAVIGGVTDIFFDTSSSASHAPAGTTAKHLIGSFKTDASGYIVPFTQAGQRFYWTTPFTDLNTATPATTPTQISLTVATGFAGITALISVSINSTTPGDFISIFNSTGELVGQVAAQVSGVSNFGNFQVLTDGSGHIKYEASSASVDTVEIFTLGYINTFCSPIY